MPKRFFLAFAALALSGGPVGAELPAAPTPVTGSLMDTAPVTLEGRWNVMIEYGPGPNAAPSREETLVITSASDGGLQGGFMGAPFGESATRKDGRTTIFFTQTQHSSGLVFHTGRISGSSVTGQSYMSGRKELLLWRGVRQAEEP